MKIKINTNYLVFPVNTHAVNKRLSFKESSNVLYSLIIKLDNLNPNFHAYIDVSRFMGREFELTCEPETEIAYSVADELIFDGLYSEPMRPQVHFTTKNGWINDPNGLIYLDGVYHMFYQHNPAEPCWNNMHWGHAESRDMLHWQERPNALFPDSRGEMFSGSAVLDEKNLIGKNTDTAAAALLFYTTTSPFCQNISYSTDGFKTVKHYENNPVVPKIVHGNRDPKVVFCDELDCYIMLIFLENNTYCILESDNLSEWTELQRFQLEGDAECPDIFCLNDGNGSRKWVIMGASDKYLVGDFVNGQFKPNGPAKPLHHGAVAYAGQSISNLPNGRVVRIVWDRWQPRQPAATFAGQMGIPMEMTLCKNGDTYYLQANPIKEIESIYNTSAVFDDIAAAPSKPFKAPLKLGAQLIKIAADFPQDGSMTLKVFGRDTIFDFAKNEFKIGDRTAPISLNREKLELTIVVDTCSIELFADGGKIYAAYLNNDTVSDRNLPYLEIKASSEITVKHLELNSLNSIWNS